MRLAAGLEYCGTAYLGWQRQPGATTVQQCVEASLSRVADHSVTAYCAGRTDTGVHALQQVIHFDTNAVRDPRGWVLGGNVHLPPDISFNWVMPVPEDFHARYSAVGRLYRYLVLNRNSRPGLHRGLVSWECRSLDEGAMSEAALQLVGKHDFSAFRARECQARSPVREIRRLEVRRRGDLLAIDVEADAFLHHMVRNIAGVLMEVGKGKADPDWVGEVLRSRDRTAGGVTAPPDGLYLVRVIYLERWGIPAPPVLPWPGPEPV